MSLPSEKNTNPSFMDVFDSVVFATHNSGFSNPKGKRKRSRGKNHQVSRFPNSVSLPHAKIMINHQNSATETHASNVNANSTIRQQGEIVKVWKQVGLIGTESSKSHIT